MAEQVTECKNKFCGKKGLMILPLRYALAAHESGHSDFPELSGMLGKGVSDKKLKSAAYTMRILRHGYLYVMTDRTKKLKWESAWAVNSEGYIAKIPLGAATPPPAFSCAPETHGVNASMISIEDAKEVTEVRVLFLPDPLTLSALSKIEKDKKLSDKLQKFKAQATAQEHAILPAELAKKVMEFRSVEAGEKRLAAFFNDHLHPVLGKGVSPENNIPHPSLSRLKNISTDLIAKKGLAIVLHDPIGIAQELGRWTNSAIRPLNDLMAKKDEFYGIQNEKLAAIIDAVFVAEEEIRKGALVRREPKRGTTAEDIRKQGSTSGVYGGNYTNIYQDDADYKRAKEAWYKNTTAVKEIGDKAWHKYETRLIKRDIYTGKRQAMDRLAAKCDALYVERSLGWLLWLNSPLLHDTLAFYDNAHLESGGAYASQVGLCIHGVNVCEDGIKWLNGQASAKQLNPGTLLLNAMMLNNKKAADDFIKAGGLSGSPLPFDKLQEGGKGLTDAWNNIKGVVEQAQNAGNAGQMSGISLLIMQAGSVMLTHMPGGKFIDKQVFTSSTMHKLLKLSLGKILTKDLADTYPDPTAYSAKLFGVNKAIRKQVNSALTQGSGSSQLNGARFGVVVAFLEMANILLKSHSMAQDSTPRARAELTAAILGLSAVLIELTGGVCEYIAKSNNPSLLSGSLVGVAGLKLSAGALGTMAGVIGAVMDFDSAGDLKEKAGGRMTILARVYYLRGMVSLAAGAVSAGLAIGAAGPFFEWLLARSPTGWLSKILTLAVRSSALLAAEQMSLLLLRGARLFTGVGIGLTIAIWLFSDNDLEAWCDQSCLRKNRKDKGFDSAEEEMAALDAAVKGVS